MVLIMCKEAFLCLQEGVADTAETLDLAMVLGSGWAPHRGGPITYARQRGVDTVRETLKSLARQYGARFEPVDLLYFPPSKQ
jgi:3-hydroxyacyl-CoA dehydrogenase/enoyl-CoA hydratase/3-hydroxybutyryl-CoA epimerase